MMILLKSETFHYRALLCTLVMEKLNFSVGRLQCCHLPVGVGEVGGWVEGWVGDGIGSLFQ